LGASSFHVPAHRSDEVLVQKQPTLPITVLSEGVKDAGFSSTPGRATAATGTTSEGDASSIQPQTSGRSRSQRQSEAMMKPNREITNDPLVDQLPTTITKVLQKQQPSVPEPLTMPDAMIHDEFEGIPDIVLGFPSSSEEDDEDDD